MVLMRQCVARNRLSNISCFSAEQGVAPVAFPEVRWLIFVCLSLPSPEIRYDLYIKLGKWCFGLSFPYLFSCSSEISVLLECLDPYTPLSGIIFI